MKRCILLTVILVSVLCWLRRTGDAGDRALVAARKEADDGERYTTDELFKELGIDE